MKVDGGARLGRYLGETLAAASVIGASAWLDALRVGRGAIPPLTWAETAALAGRGGALLAGPILGTLVLVFAVSALGRGGAGWTLPVLAGWGSAFGVLCLSDFSVKGGWIAAALLLGISGAWAAARLVRRSARAGSARRPSARGAAAATAAAVILWAPMWVISPASPSEIGPAAAAPGGGRPGILLIVIDALRADHLGAYGYARPTSPAIDKLAKGGVRFDAAVAPSSWTLPSMASILTSSYPGQHGVAEKGAILSPEIEDLAGRLQKAGYTTAAFTTNPWLKRPFGFDHGFSEYYDLDRLDLARRLLGVRLKNLVLRRLNRIRVDPELVPKADDVTDRGIQWLGRHGGDPFFLYLHYMDVHAPYDPVAPYHGMFCKGHRFALPDHILETRFRSGGFRGDAAVMEHVIELYDEDILAADTAVGRLLSSLGRLGLRERTTVVLAADHGEEFYEHGKCTHGNNLYQQVVRVPLIVDTPGARTSGGRVVATRVSTLDIFPTILDLAGAPAERGIEGVSLARYLAPDAGGEATAAAARPIGSQLFLDGRPWTALFIGSDKLIRVRPPASDPSAVSRVELYDLDVDPGETLDVAETERERAAALASALDGFEKVWGIPGLGSRRPGEAIDPETLKQLKALGYIN